MTFYLLLCLVVNDTLRPVMALNDTPYRTQSECNQVRTHGAVVSSYGEAFEGAVLVCKKLR